MKRRIGLDLIKVLAATFVIMVHHFDRLGFYQNIYDNSIKGILLTGMYLITSTAVPLFLTATGYLLANREPNREHFLKAIYFFVEVFLIIAGGILIIQIYNSSFSISNWISAVILKMLNPSYYVGLYFSLYLVAPFINILINELKSDSKKILFLIIIVFVISLPNFLNKIPYVNLFDIRPTNVWSILYYVIGFNIRDFQPVLNKWINVLLILLISVSYGLIINYVLVGNVYSHYFGYYENIFVVGVSSLLFILLYRLDIKAIFLRKSIMFLSSSTLTFYMFSVMFSDQIASSLLTYSDSLIRNTVLTMIPITLFSFTISSPLALFVYWSQKGIKSILDKVLVK